jgi:hypothetical protein
MHEDFVSFEKALRELQMRSEELKKLVSEGEIRAFRDGESMKFKREDIEGLSSGEGEEELVFADVLEDDTGMATEELSEEDTLLADVDLEEEEEAAPRARRTRAAVPARTARARIAEDETSEGEPGWVTAAVIVGTLLLIWGLLVTMDIAAGKVPSGVTGMFAPSSTTGN